MADVADILARQQAKQKSTLVERETPMELDVGLLAVFDPNALEDPSYTMERESYLQSQARDGVQTLVNALFSLPTTSTSDAVIANLPLGGPTTALPRAKPLPKPKPLTKWERFAKAKGIAPKPKREKMVFDEEKQEWVARWGWKGKNKDEEQAWIREVKPGEEDGVEANPGKRARKERVLKNEQQRLKNLERAAAATAKASASSTAAPDALTDHVAVNGSTTVRSKADLRAQKIAANAAKTSAEGAARRAAQGERKEEIDGLLRTTKRSTASMGKFDKSLVGEPKQKGLKRKFEATEMPTSAEKSSHMAVVERLAKDPSAFAEKAVKRGKKTSTAGGKKAADDGVVNTRKAIRAVSGGVGSGAFADKAAKRKGGKKR